jgi:16S rRNA (cytosine967-C5)-methyltransferase
LAKLLCRPANARLEARDLGLARAISANALRYERPFNSLLSGFIEKPLPAKHDRISAILLAATVQLLFLQTPPHAAISLAVEQTRRTHNASHLAGLVNAVLRKVSALGADTADRTALAKKAMPDWLMRRWRAAYGDETAAAIAVASLREAPLDLSVKDNSKAPALAEQLGAVQLATGSLRLDDASGRIEDLPGFEEGAWWVQDAAAALPPRLLGALEGQSIADLCAAPGGKTFVIAAAGARVTAVDISPARLARVSENLQRLKLEAQCIEADAADWSPGRTFDAVLLDAPCTATGTIRRHPDILHLKREADVDALAGIQRRLIDHAATLVRPGGLLVFCTCSLQPEEGERQAVRFLADHPGWELKPVEPGEAGITPEWITAEGFFRTLPFHSPPRAPSSTETGDATSESTEMPPPGMDGFFAARFRRLD